jgi:hypothetical protein
VHRLSPTLRALLLVPLLAVGVDQTRAVVLCGQNAQGCLEAAGRGWIGLWGVALIAAYSIALAMLVARAAGDPAARARLSFARLWAIGTVGVAAACGGQALLAAALGGAPLGGGWLGLLALCVAAGALLALALRAAPALAESLRTAALRPAAAAPTLCLSPSLLDTAAGRTPARRPRGRAPPRTI